MGFAALELATALLRDGELVLLVASRYPNHAQPLWQLPGGRRRDGETLFAALRRELLEETQLALSEARLAYVSESFDRAGNVRVVNFTFEARALGAASLPPREAHVVDLAWVGPAELGARITAGVVREPLLAYLRGDPRRYYEFTDAGISIAFADEP